MLGNDAGVGNTPEGKSGPCSEAAPQTAETRTSAPSLLASPATSSGQRSGAAKTASKAGPLKTCFIRKPRGLRRCLGIQSVDSPAVAVSRVEHAVVQAVGPS